MALLCQKSLASPQPNVNIEKIFWPIPSIQSDTDLAETLQKTLDRTRLSTHTVGVSAAIFQGGRSRWVGFSGNAVQQTKHPVDRNTLFSLASVTKLFVATIVLRLYEEGKIKLDMPISHYVPSYVPDGDRVTVRQLLAHTSGYPDVEGDATILRWLEDPNHHWTRTQLMRQIQSVQFQPGTDFFYSNTNYILLGQVIESVSPAGIDGAFQHFIVQPAGLSHNAIFRREPSAAPRIAHGYNVIKGKRQDAFKNARNLGVPTSVWGTVWTDGGIAATASSVAQFADRLFSDKLLKLSTLKMMTTPVLGGEGLGVQFISLGGHNWWGHFGAFNGFSSVVLYDPSRHLTIAATSNTLGFQRPNLPIVEEIIRVLEEKTLLPQNF